VLVAVALWSLLLIPAFFGYFPIHDDLGAYHAPLRYVYQHCLQQGQEWRWSPALFAGYDVHGEGQLGGEHPLHQLLYRVLPFPLAFGVEIWWPYLAGFYGVWFWLRQLGFARRTAIYGGICFALAGFCTLRFVHVNATQVIAHVPWLLGLQAALFRQARSAECGVRNAGRGKLQIDNFAAFQPLASSLQPLVAPQPPTPNPQSPFCNAQSSIPLLLAIALLTGSQLLLGYPQYVLYSLIAEAIGLLWCARRLAKCDRLTVTLADRGVRKAGRGAGDEGRGEILNAEYKVRSTECDSIILPSPLPPQRPTPNPQSPIPKFLLLYCSAKLLGLLLGAAQVIPTLAYLADSERATWSAAASLEGSWHPLNAVQFIAPYLFASRVVGQNTHELTCYFGAVPLLLVVLGAVTPVLSTRRRQVRWLAWALIGVGLLVATGEYGPLAKLLPLVPYLNQLRFPSRAMLLTLFGLVLLAACGLSRLNQLARTRRAAARQLQTRPAWTTRERLALRLTVAASFLLIVIGNARWSEWLSPLPRQLAGPALLLVGLAILELWICNACGAKFALVAFTILDLGIYAASTAGFQTWRQVPATAGGFAAQWQTDPTIPYAGWGVRAARAELLGASLLNGKRLQVGNQNLWQATPEFPAPRARWDGYAGVKPWYAATANFRNPQSTAPRAFLKEALPQRASYVSGKNLTFNELFTPSATLHESSSYSASPFRTPHSAFRTSLKPAWLTNAQPLIHQFTNDLPGKMSLTCTVARPGWLITNESSHSGWQATVNGKAVPVSAFAGGFIGCEVPAGSSQIAFVYAAPAHVWGRIASYCGLGLWCLGAVFAIRAQCRVKSEQKRSRTQPPEQQRTLQKP